MNVSREQAVAYRLRVNNLAHRLPAGRYVEAAHVGLQDTAPRDALLGLHARVEACEPTAWEAPGLIQTYSPRRAVYVLPEADFGVFTIGRLPRDPLARQRIEDLAESVCRALDGEERQSAQPPSSREACASGRIALRWTASALHIRERPRPTIDPAHARLELCRRHVHAFGPTTPAAFAWWAGVSIRDARQTWQELAEELIPVDLSGHSAWILARDESTLAKARAPRGVRLLAAPDLRIFGQDKTGLFVGPGQRKHSALQDSHHPNGVMVDGRIAGAWGRKGGQVTVKMDQRLKEVAITEEALAMPIPGVEMTVTLRG